MHNKFYFCIHKIKRKLYILISWLVESQNYCFRSKNIFAGWEFFLGSPKFMCP
jgi:hypothetical protein